MNDIDLEIAYVPGGTFVMGTQNPTQRTWDDECPAHSVTIQPFFIGKYPVTQAQWRVIASRTDLKVERDIEPDPYYFKGDDRPVEQVSWYDAVEFCTRLSILTGLGFRLPSEAEWEYACRAGTTTAYYFGDTITSKLANYDMSFEETTPVGQFPPNTFGLYDMHGNVWEWCADAWHANYDGAPTDGSAWLSDSERQYNLMRGGSFYNNPDYCRSAVRGLCNPVNSNNNVGLRVVCSCLQEADRAMRGGSFVSKPVNCRSAFRNKYNPGNRSNSVGLRVVYSEEKADRVMRGGSFYNNPDYCRSAIRDHDDPDNSNVNVGLRVVCSGDVIVDAIKSN